MTSDDNDLRAITVNGGFAVASNGSKYIIIETAGMKEQMDCQHSRVAFSSMRVVDLGDTFCDVAIFRCCACGYKLASGELQCGTIIETREDTRSKRRTN